MPPITFLLREQEEDKEEKENAKTFVVDQFKSEGSRLLVAKKYQEARHYFKLSMFYYKEDKFTLINRSICNLKLGYYKQAMKEIDKVLHLNAKNVKALMQKGDIFYAMGNLEWALVFYYRGKHLTKNFKRAIMWIYICHNHILDNVGDSRMLLTTEGDKTFLTNQINEDNFSTSEKVFHEQAIKKKENKNEKKQNIESVVEIKKNREVMTMMGNLYNDRLYLERLYDEADVTSRTGREIKERAYAMIEYIDKQVVRKFRTEPPGEKKFRSEPLVTAFQLKKQYNVTVSRELNLIDLEQREGKYEESLQRCKQLLDAVLSHPRISKLEEVIATIYGFLGNAHLRLDDLSNAFVYFSKEKDLSNRHHLENTKLHSLHCLGVVSVLKGDYKRATKIWTIRLSYAKTPDEKCWLQHEIARCHFALDDWPKAHAIALKAYKETLGTQDLQWQLNCLILLAQIETRLPNLDHATVNYGKALKFAQKLQDADLIDGIECALKDLKNQQILIANNQALQADPYKQVGVQTKKVEYLSAEEVMRGRRVPSTASVSESKTKTVTEPKPKTMKNEEEEEEVDLLDGKQYNRFFGSLSRLADEKYAFVTMATNNTYAVSALVLAETIKNTGTRHDLVVIVTEEVHEEVMRLLKAAFTRVEVVNVIDSQDHESLSLLQRHELGVTFTKLHSWRLTQYDKCVFLDADTIVLQNIDDLFERDPFAAAPDSGWPDCFNSGVFLYRPCLETFQTLLDFAFKVGSFDGGDQGLLNLFFSDWATKDIKFHLPVTYNLPWHSFYSYKPALKQYGHQVKVIHFIGTPKPWVYDWDPVMERVLCRPEQVSFNTELLQIWWDVFMSGVKNNLPPEVLQEVGNFSRLKVRSFVSHTEALLLQKQRQLVWEEGNDVPDEAQEADETEETTERPETDELIPLVCLKLSQLPPELLKHESMHMRTSKDQ